MQFILFQPIRSKDMDSLGTARKMPDIQIIVPAIQKIFFAFILIQLILWDPTGLVLDNER